MKLLLTLALATSLTAWTVPAKALTNDDLVGTYQGTSVATLPTGQTVTANLTVTFKSSGKIKTSAVVNGQTTTGKGKLQFISEYGITQTTDGAEAVGFVDLNGKTLILNLLVRLDSGEIIKEVTTVNKQ